MYETFMSLVDHVIMIGWALLILVTLALIGVWMLISLRLLSMVRDLGRQYTLLKEKVYEPVMYIRFLFAYLTWSASKKSSKEQKSQEKKKSD